jgi:hypothetical protein
MSEPLDLRQHIDHGIAPLWFVAERGTGRPTSHPLLCPVCGTEKVHIRAGGSWQDSYIVSYAQRGGETIRTTDGERDTHDPEGRGLSIAIPLSCWTSMAMVTAELVALACSWTTSITRSFTPR